MTDITPKPGIEQKPKAAQHRSEDVTLITKPPAPINDVSTDTEAYLIVMSGNNVGQVFNISQPQVSIGRDVNSDIQILDAGISRQHAQIKRDPQGGFILYDAGSRNGTYANNALVEKVYRLQDGDWIQLGMMTVLKFAYVDNPEANFANVMFEAAHRDPLTQVFNRRYFEERLRSEFFFATRHPNKTLSLLLLDLDHFKSVNDTFGHQTGDMVLNTIADLLEKATRAEDVLARYGGEEFVILCRQTTLQKALILAERIRNRIAEYRFAVEESTFSITVSIGVTALPNSNVETPEDFFKAADDALYQAKDRGRNQVVTDSSWESSTS